MQNSFGDIVKQPMAYSKGKAHKIRHARKTASSMKGRSKVYRRIESMSEVGAGTDKYRVTVTLVEGWSFSDKTNINVATFTSIANLMRGVSMTFRAPELIEIDVEALKAEEEIEMTWQEKLEALTKLSKQE